MGTNGNPSVAPAKSREACVVTEEERRVLGDVGDLENPWRRYVRAGITLAHNPLWPEKHKGLIESAGLKAE